MLLLIINESNKSPTKAAKIISTRAILVALDGEGNNCVDRIVNINLGVQDFWRWDTIPTLLVSNLIKI